MRTHFIHIFSLFALACTPQSNDPDKTADNEDTAAPNASSDDTEYVDDPQIDLMTA